MQKIHVVFLIVIAIAMLWFGASREGFQADFQDIGILYKVNPCGDYTDCRSCADAAGCGWCADSGTCAPMARDGFPIRYRDRFGSRRPICAPYGFQSRPEMCV